MKALISASVAIGLACLGTAARADVSTAARAEGCCMIIAIDGTSGVVTAENKTTARQFQFRAVDAHTLQRLYVGESVDVDPNGQVRAADALKH